MAISGEMPIRPLSSMESVLRDTASPFAASVTLGSSRQVRDNESDAREAFA